MIPYIPVIVIVVAVLIGIVALSESDAMIDQVSGAIAHASALIRFHRGIPGIASRVWAVGPGLLSRLGVGDLLYAIVGK